MTNPIAKYFRDLSPGVINKLEHLEKEFRSWNMRVNLISRRDMDNFMLHHVIHSLSVSKVFDFKAGTKILDAGTGGGLPGLPLAIIYPECEFTLVDSIRKKINAVNGLIDSLDLSNVKTVWSRVEELDESFDFVVSRAVAPFPDLVKWTHNLVRKESLNKLPNGILALKGGDLESELSSFPGCRQYNLRDLYEEEYFSEKKIVYLPVSQM